MRTATHMLKRGDLPDPEGGGSGVGELFDPCRQLFEMLPDRMCLLSPEGLVLQFNPSFQDASDVPLGEWSGFRYDEMFPEAIAEPRMKIFRKVLRSGKAGEFTDHLNGVWLEHRFFPFKDEQGSVRAVALISRDITEMILIKKSSDEIGQRLEFLLDHLPGMIYRCSNDPGWPMVYASGGAFELTGIPSESFTMKNPFLYTECIHPEDRAYVWQTVQEAVAENRSFSMEYRIRDASDEEKWVWERGKRIQEERGDSCWLEGIILDISSRKNLEVLREEQNKNEMRIGKAESLARMAGGVAHHFNNKLQAVIGNLQLAQLHLQEHPEQPSGIEPHLEAAFEAARTASSVSLNLLTFLGQRQHAPERIDLAGFIPEFCRRHVEEFQTLISIAEGHFPVFASCRDLEEIFSQALLNAKEAAPGKPVSIKLRAIQMKSRPGVEIVFLDKGPGVPPEAREQIFEPFFSTKFPGRGLGLAMVEGITRNMNGTVEMLANPSGGAQLRLRFPLHSRSSP